jgi:hypothetical protein
VTAAQATGYDLEQGVQLYFATHGEDAAQGAPPAQQAPGPGYGSLHSISPRITSI